MANVMLKNFRRFFFGMSSEVPEFKVHVFASATLNLELE